MFLTAYGFLFVSFRAQANLGDGAMLWRDRRRWTSRQGASEPGNSDPGCTVSNMGICKCQYVGIRASVFTHTVSLTEFVVVRAGG